MPFGMVVIKGCLHLLDKRCKYMSLNTKVKLLGNICTGTLPQRASNYILIQGLKGFSIGDGATI